ncbi:hypothetical protein Mal4_04720 [Maioricimonas rarisocia]|uniref:Uncharacterized protein n=1 Tax=Maioricimonas rarisocia TaxID=2528026 RepID=A0A517Z140_9PLAN|nr:hypothetical protein [Maioricimonas rarisocia]QDU36188.1 hypothetical protein Mal4_04720 [Maioricimonas rarisocia]
MQTLRELWRDECGAVLSAEVVLLGTLGVIGATVGLSALSKSVNDELTELAFAVRSLDQSYGYKGMKGCGSWTAGSCYTQPPVEESLAELGVYVDELEERAEQEADSEKIRPRLTPKKAPEPELEEKAKRPRKKRPAPEDRSKRQRKPREFREEPGAVGV